uniref:Cytochrome P450 n=2 Tax=Rhodonia placenta TaxID=104341 RepID=F1SYF2_9APHY|nr:cytochrome P450 [Postia placenta]
MPLPLDSYVLLCVSVLLVVAAHYAYSRWLFSTRRLPLPPGPPRAPFLGNIHQVPLMSQHKKFAEWSRNCGDLFCVQIFHKSMLIISSIQVARDLLETRSAKYSDRPYSVVANEFVFPFRRPILGLMPYDERFRRLRKWFQGALETKASLQQYHHIQRREVGRLLSDLVHTPKEFFSHIRRYNGALMLEIAYGHPVASAEDEYMAFADRSVAALTDIGSIASTLVDFVPILKYIPTWMPGAGFKRQALRAKDMWAEMTRIPYQRVRDDMALGKAKLSFTTFMIQEVSRDGHLTDNDEYDISNSASQMYGAGVETTLHTLLTLLLAFTIYPKVVDKAQAEIDRVIGTSRLPELADREFLPYLGCIVQEVLRWNPITPLGVPHCLQEDDSYNGYGLPGGSMFIINVWAISRNPALYPNPEVFRPERFEEMDAETASARDPRKYLFGFGRRICPGRYLADSSVWLVAANVLATMDIRRARDSAGREIIPTPSFKGGIVSHVEPFECDIRPRSQKTIDLIAERHYETTD